MYRAFLALLALTVCCSPALAQNKSQKQKSQKEWTGGPQPAIQPAAPPVTRFTSRYARGTIVIDTRRRRLLYVLFASKAYLYPITVGRHGFQWSGTKRITAKKDWPTWRPPAEMRKRQPNLPVVMTGGIHNPLGAKALYLGSTLYRIHGTNNAKSLGLAPSSGCFRMHNAHVTHLSQLARIGTKVVVLKALPGKQAQSFSSQKVQALLPAGSPSPQQRTRKVNLAWRAAILGTN